MRLSHVNLRDLKDVDYQLIKNRLSASPVPAVDIIILHKEKGKKGIVLIERKNEPKGLAIPGGLVELGTSYEETAIKEAKEETSLDIKLLNPNHPYAFSTIHRDPRGHIPTQVYIAKSKKGKLAAGDDAKEAHLYDLNEIKKLIRNKKIIADHGKILNHIIKKEKLL